MINLKKIHFNVHLLLLIMVYNKYRWIQVSVMLSVTWYIYFVFTFIYNILFLLVRFHRELRRGTTIWPECTASTSSTASTLVTWPHSSTRTWDGRTWASAGVRPRPSHVQPAAGSAWPPRCRCQSSTCAELCPRTRRIRWRSTRDWIRPSRRGWRWAHPPPSPVT